MLTPVGLGKFKQAHSTEDVSCQAQPQTCHFAVPHRSAPEISQNLQGRQSVITTVFKHYVRNILHALN